jgi:predicted nuclease of restriction endonuclease-like (RecB) superfamily
MNKRLNLPSKKSKPVIEKQLRLDKHYKSLLSDIKSRLKKAQLRAAIVVNHELIKFYWEIGRLIIERQKQAKWGDRLFETLAEDLRQSFPNTQGFSKTNLKYMKSFASHYPAGEFGQALPDQLTWTHHVVLIQAMKPKELAIKQWYAEQVVKNGWAYRELQEQIVSDVYSRQAHEKIKTTNFHGKLPALQSNLAQEMIKEPYKFHFLTVGDDAHEKEVQSGLIGHIKQFLMELGQGFSLYGIHYPVQVSGKRFEIDLLMYNTKLHCYFVIEIKRGDFHPKHTGQLNFYLSAIDEQLKMPEDGPTIGLLLCEKKDRVIAEYALRRIQSPMSISEYELGKSLPPQLHAVLPTTIEIEQELNQFTKNTSGKKKKISKK